MRPEDRGSARALIWLMQHFQRPRSQADLDEVQRRYKLGTFFYIGMSKDAALKARETLKKSTPYDVHPSAFPVGKGVTTIFAKTSITLRQPQADCWELIVRRSFADYIYRWLLDAAAEFGVSVER